jgi:hypothetical protein
VEHGADVGAKNAHGETPADIAYNVKFYFPTNGDVYTLLGSEAPCYGPGQIGLPQTILLGRTPIWLPVAEAQCIAEQGCVAVIELG